MIALGKPFAPWNTARDVYKLLSFKIKVIIWWQENMQSNIGPGSCWQMLANLIPEFLRTSKRETFFGVTPFLDHLFRFMLVSVMKRPILVPLSCNRQYLHQYISLDSIILPLSIPLSMHSRGSRSANLLPCSDFDEIEIRRTWHPTSESLSAPKILK